MKIDLNEIWEFMEMAPQPKTANQGDQWIYELVAGDVRVKNLKSKDIASLQIEEHYDTELLPSIFTFREILWQPNVYTKPSLCIPQLNILKVFCEEYVEEIKKAQNGNAWPYFRLLHGLSKYCGQALKKISSVEKQQDLRISSILGDLRKNAFPIIKFFIFHPMNRKDYQRDALNRLNYAVKIMLTQYNNKYYDLRDPHWNVTVGNAKKTAQTEVSKKTQEQPDKTSATTTDQVSNTKSPVQMKQKTTQHVIAKVRDHELEL